MSSLSEQNDISSAEMTAVYRSAIPALSGDIYSEKLATQAGKEKAAAFIERYDYPLVNRKISVRAGYCLSEATRLLSSGQYDSCISFASGFSLLLYHIATKNLVDNDINYFDTDLPHMVEARLQRVAAISSLLDTAALNKIQTKAFDIEKAYQQNQKLQDVFPDCHKPIFIAEGISYFLSPGCVEWLIEQMGSYKLSAVIMDYWPENIFEISSLFANIFKELNQGIILEPIKSFWSNAAIAKFKKQFPYTSDWALAELDQKMSHAQRPRLEPELIDPNTYFPLRLITGEKQIQRLS